MVWKLPLGASAMRSFWSDRDGNVMVAFGLIAPVLVAAVALAVDYSDAGRLQG